MCQCLESYSRLKIQLLRVAAPGILVPRNIHYSSQVYTCDTILYIYHMLRYITYIRKVKAFLAEKAQKECCANIVSNECLYAL